MLKKWKAEKDQRKKEDERNRKAPAFKVSGKIERKDASSLYNKPTAVRSFQFCLFCCFLTSDIAVGMIRISQRHRRWLEA